MNKIITDDKHKMLRSERMEYVQLYFSKKNIEESLKRLGDASVIMLENSAPEDDISEIDTSEIEKVEQLLQFIKKHSLNKERRIYGDSSSLNKSFEEVAKEVSEAYSKVSEISSQIEDYKERLIRLEEDYYIAKEANKFFKHGSGDKIEDNESVIGGIVDAEEYLKIKLLLRSRLRRNVLIKKVDVLLEYSERERKVLIAQILKTGADIAHRVFKTTGVRMHIPKTNPNTIENSFNILQADLSHFSRQLEFLLSEAEERYKVWERSIYREKKVKEALSILKDRGSYILGEGWIPARWLPALNNLCSSDGEKGRFTFEVQKHTLIPPTSIKTTNITSAFQNLTNVFGIPKYDELNPAVFLMFTFPFLFGAMFGDLFHAIILFFASLFLIFFFDRINGKCNVFQIILNGRYVMLLCSITSAWFGLLYGDFGSLSLSLFPSSYDNLGRRIRGRSYPFGIDPVWHSAENGMIFVNNLKMKLSLILGFVHMSLGAVIATINAYHRKDSITLLCEAIPQFIAFVLFLGYVVFLCFYKWLVTINYPSIVSTLITMYTEPFGLKESIYPGQLYVQLFILSTMVICIPWMFFGKPVYLIFRRKIPDNGILDLWISSGIHVVEFGLGLISNTSSYLRLWAVSLAHVQLTSVLHQFTIGNSSFFVKIATFPVYFVTTIVLLIGLEGLSSVLHALRLNWIEFFSKFYSGEGRLFKPYNFVQEDPDE